MYSLFFTNKLSSLYKFFFLFFLFSYLISISFAIQPEILITEDIDINYLNSYQKASIQVEGVLEIKNPSLIDTIYEVNIPIELDSLIGFSKREIYNDGYVLINDSFSFEYNKIKTQLIKPNQTVKVGYMFYGIVNYDISLNTTQKNISFLEYYSKNFNLLSNVIINLQKANREENEVINNTYIYEPGFENSSGRLVSTEVKNPTGFNLELKELKVYRTSSTNPMYGGGDLIKTFRNINFDPYAQQTFDVFDYNSDDYSVYWVSSKLLINPILNNNISYNLRFPASSGSRGGDSTGGSDTFFPEEKSNLLIKKTTDKTLISSGEEFTVTISVINLGFGTLDNLSLLDEIPANYVMSDVTQGVKIGKENNLNFEIKQIKGYDEYSVSYTLVNKNDLRGVTYLQPASINFENISYFSDGVLIISDLLPDKKVYIQKKIELVSDDFSRVTITVKNLGTNILTDLLITDIIDKNSILKQISKVFDERGVWSIKTLSPGEEWEVTYLVERNFQIETLPNIFGVDSDDVFGTLIFTEQVTTVFQEAPRTVEKVGMIVAVGLLVFYLLF